MHRLAVEVEAETSNLHEDDALPAPARVRRKVRAEPGLGGGYVRAVGVLAGARGGASVAGFERGVAAARDDVVGDGGVCLAAVGHVRGVVRDVQPVGTLDGCLAVAPGENGMVCEDLWGGG